MDIQHEDNPLATGAWLPAGDAAPPAQNRETTASTQDEGPSDESTARRSSWLPPELISELQREDFSASPAGAPAPAPKTVLAPVQRSTAKPASAPLATAVVSEELSGAPPSPPAAPAAGGLSGTLPPRALSTPELSTPASSGDATSATAEFKAPDGDDENADYGRRTRAVTAYCREVFPGGDAPAIAEQILDSLTGGVSDDALLLQMTRRVAAQRLTNGTDPTGEEVPEACAATPGRLAARANEALTGRERDRLERHLASCLLCTAAELRVVRADRAFAAVLGLKLNRPTTGG